jgi:hypothetical protein
MANAKTQVETTTKALENAKAELAKAVDDESREMWQDVVD